MNTNNTLKKPVAVPSWQPIETAPEDCDTVEVYWEDETGQRYIALAHHVSLDMAEKLGWPPEDAGWWHHVNSLSQEQIEPTFWRPFFQPLMDTDEH